ncbi:MAG: OmpA family protein [Bacteroidales bacterium]|nr:OmpA family protein [Bacteroidales bacterium]
MHPLFSRDYNIYFLSRSKLVIAFLLLHSAFTFSQSANLVPNPSFEQKVDFQSSSSGSNWTKCLKNDTPDYIEFTSRGDPEFYYSKYIGGLLPFDGEAYAGIFCFRTNPLRGVENVREFIQAPLIETLQKDTLYVVSLVIALDPESTTAINNFNVYFGREPVSFKREKQMFELRPQVRFKQSYFDSISWVKLETIYRAKGYESQIILGNFLTDNAIRKRSVYHESQMMKKWDLHELERASYYYIDMVSVMKKSLRTQILEDEEDTEELQVLPDLSMESPDTSFIEIGQVNQDSSIVLNDIFFEFDESYLLPESYKELDRLFEQLFIFQDLSIVIEGHTDNMGTFEYNMKLSNERAQAVVGYLLDKGLSENRITYEGFGYTKPLSDNRSDAGRQMNRRVAFRITKSEENRQ